MKTKRKEIFYSGTGNEGEKREKTGEGLLRDPFFRKRFHTICHFASGGMGVISKAKDLALDRIVAVKSLKEEFRNDPEQMASFLRECCFQAKLDHPAIVPIYAMGVSDEGALSAAMKFINGISLKEFLLQEREKCRSSRQTCGEGPALRRRLEYFLRICEAVAYCHSMQIVHGDLKPENIQLGTFGELYVMDWGCARSEGSTPRHAAGTLNYLPPEFLRKKLVTPTLDIYALGMILFELVTLRRARNSTRESGKEKSAFTVYDRKSSFFYPGRKAIPPRLRAIILKAVHRDPEKRYGKVEDLMQDVRGYLFYGEVKAYPESFFQFVIRSFQKNPVLSLSCTFLLILSLSCGWLLTLLFHTYEEEKAQEEVIRRTRMIASVHLLSLPVARELLRVRSKLLILADNAVMSRSPLLTGPGEDSLPLPLPTASHFLEICRKVRSHDIYFFPAVQDLRNRPQLLFYPAYSSVKSMGVHWENGSLYRYVGGKIRKNFRAGLPFPGLPGRIYWEDAVFLPEAGRYFLFCHVPLYGKNGRYFGKAFLELDLGKVLAPLFRFKNHFPEHDLYFLLCSGQVFRILKEGLTLLGEGKNSGQSLTCGRSLRKILQGCRTANKMLVTASPEGVPCYAALAELPVADAQILLLIRKRDDREKRKDPLVEFPGTVGIF